MSICQLHALKTSNLAEVSQFLEAENELLLTFSNATFEIRTLRSKLYEQGQFFKIENRLLLC